MPLDPTLEYPFPNPPTECELHEVADGIYWLRFPLPFQLNHVHAWLLRDHNGWCLIDCGIGGQRMKDAWQHIIASMLDNKPITRLVVTHYHPDHVGSAAALDELQRPQLLMHETEWLYARMFALDTTRTKDQAVHEYLQRTALPDDMATKLLARRSRYADGVPVPPLRLHPVVAGDVLTINGTPWHVMVGSGHSPAMLTLYCPSRKIYISSDQVLPNISPNVSVWSYNPLENPLKPFLQSLAESAALAEDTLVLPSHGLPFIGVQKRCQTLIEHHQERLQHVLEHCRQPANAHSLMLGMFPQALDEHQTMFALGETLAHINYLVEDGHLHRHTNSHGQWEFLAA